MAAPRTIAILLFEGVNTLDVAGPLEAFAAVRRDDGSPAYSLAFWTLPGCPDQVRSEGGLKLCADCPAPEGEAASADILLLPGGCGVRAPQTLSALAAWLRRHHQGFTRVASICTGAYALAESGLVDGRNVTTHWAHADDLRRRYPAVTVRSEALFSQDGRFYSSGGVTSGIDLALDLIESDCGAAAAMAAARELVVFLRRTGSQAQFSEPLRMQARAVGSLSDVCAWAANHLGADLSVEALAARAHLSPRQFSRRFRSAFGTAPAGYIKRLRLDAARAALVQRGASVEEIAHANGFGSVDGFRRAFEQHFQVNPGEYQRRFSAQERRA